ncbi:MAG: hypothetical protein AB1757_15005 [Acidobacteriota bacterium]
MQERVISTQDAEQIIRNWQEEQPAVEVLIRFSQGLTQTHAGQVRLEPEGQVVIAHILDKNHYLTTTLDIFGFERIRLSEMSNAITFEEPFASSGTFRSVTIARRRL